MVNMDHPDMIKALTTIAYPCEASTAPLECLSQLLASQSRPWPVFALQVAYAKAWRHLPEDIKAGTGPPHIQTLVNHVEHQVRSCYTTLLDLLPQSTNAAIKDSNSASVLTHQTLSTFVRAFRLQYQVPGSGKPKVALALPNGPLLGIAILTTVTHFICCPLSVASGPEQFRSDLSQSGASIVFVTAPDVKRLGLDDDWVSAASIHVVVLDMDHQLTFTMKYLDSGLDLVPTQDTTSTPNQPDDVVLMLFTSGTSGTKKTVPITLRSLVSGIAFVIDSWGLTSSDSCLNQMPLFHVGGIVRNLFAPIMAGGSTICCSAFDSNSFWDIVEDLGPTWYYASPTMHSMILDTAKFRPDALSKCKIRLVANAAGGLLPSLACQLRETFNCTVLPSYGMTEAMPISSPPLDYRLDRPGTSGKSVGPDLAILDGCDKFLPINQVGRIAVRGAPVFTGYLRADGSKDTSPFTDAGFFDTGDLGYLDADGFLYVTGRSKEVINRGGELISPFEVEEAVLSSSQQSGSPIEGRISAALAFSMPHDVLQETVGLCVVTTPGKPRACLKTVQGAIRDSLSQVKWPQTIVYMTDLPKNNNKLLRIKLGERMNMPDLTDETLMADRHYEADCPPPNTPLSEKIASRAHQFDRQKIKEALAAAFGPQLDIFVRSSKACGYPEVVVTPTDGYFTEKQSPPDMDAVHELKGSLDDLNIPASYHWLETGLPKHADGTVNHLELDEHISRIQRSSSVDSSFSVMEKKIADLFAQILACPASDLRRDSDFFALGGDSIRAGRLLSELRRESKARIPVDLLFTCGQICSLSEYIEKTISSDSSAESRKEFVDTEQVIEKTCSSTNPFLMLVQLVPIMLVYPMKRALTWTVFMYCLAETLHWPTANYLPGRLFSLILSLAAGRLVSFSFAPLFGIAFKWLVIGKYRPGLYPMWGFYHTRWWLCEKVLSICGRGHFTMSNATLIFYYRLLGAKIGSGVTIAKSTTLGEYDLLDIGDGVNLDTCICRGFAAEKNTAMYLGPVRIGNNCSVGLKSIIAPGSVIPENTCIGPNSSSWEMADADESNRNLSASKRVGGNPILDLLVGFFPALFINIARVIPWVAGLIGLVIVGPDKKADKILSVLDWFSEPYRISFHYFALILHAYFGPMTWFLALVAVKKVIDLTLGKVEPGPAESKSLRQKLRSSLLKKLISQKRFHKLLDILGAHYELTSILYRQLGAKVGQRVYWPGTGPSIQGEFDLLEIGDDVVFGSRSHISTSDGYGSEAVKIRNGAMISDRVVLLPGADIGDGAVFGSGALSRRDKAYPPRTVWVGSRAGEAVCLTDTRSRRSPGSVDKDVLEVEEKAKYELDSISSTPAASIMEVRASPTATSPFGRAFYHHLAPYKVFPLPVIVLYSSLVTVFTAFYWNVGATSSVQILAHLLPGMSISSSPHSARPFIIYALFTAFISLLQSLLAVLALALTIAAKWALLGRRRPGNYDWDKSPYCQRWQLYLTVERLRRSCYAGDGVLGLLTGTHYMVVYFRLLGAKIGRDCALFAGGKPSCMLTEPDLLTMGDRVVVDDASLVGHINSRGVFDLNPLEVGSGSVLRSGSRLLSGAKMGADAVLLEHTLVMAGDEVRDGTARQGWPSEEYEGLRMPSLVTVGGEKV